MNRRAYIFLALYCLGSLGVFFTHFFRFNVKQLSEVFVLIAVFTVSALAYVGLVRAVSGLQAEIPLKLVRFLALGALFFIVLYFFMPPPYYAADDRKIYYFHGKIYTVYHANPYQVTPASFSSDPEFSQVTTWTQQKYNYGPVWLWIAGAIAKLSGSLELAVRNFQMLALIAFIGMASLIQKIFSDQKRTWLFLINPLMLYWGVSGGHNDVVMMFFVVLAWYLAKRQRWNFFAASLALAVLIKYIAILFVPVLAIYAWSAVPRKKRIRMLFSMSGIFIGLIVLAYLPFAANTQDFLGGDTLINPRLSGPVFSLFYLLTQKTFMFRATGFLTLKNIFGIIFVLLIFLALWVTRKPQGFEEIPKRILLVLSVFFILTFWFQPWYALWISPFIFLPTRRWLDFFHASIILLSLLFYVFSYTFSSFFGVLVSFILASLFLIKNLR